MTHVAFALLFLWAAVEIGEGQTPAQAAVQLAGRISSQLQRHPTVSLELQNLSVLTPVQLSSFRSAFIEELSKAGLATTTTQPEMRMRLTVSENTRGLLLVAELISGDNRSVIMQPWIAPPAKEGKPPFRILRSPIWDQPEPVLDLLLNSDSELVVLSPTTVSTFRMTDGHWAPTGVAGLSLARPLARDPRGRIQNTPGGLRVTLPGTTCNGALQPTLKFTCASGNEAWPVSPREPGIVARWVNDRNTLESDSFPSTFYTAANGWFSTPDHRIIDRSGNSLAVPEAWGSDFASIESSCGSNSTVLVSGPSDNPDRDQVRVYEIANGHATPVSEPMTLPGPITALWPGEPAGQATLVVRNSKTGNYEASRLGVACSE
jgi:hypothetical protein